MEGQQILRTHGLATGPGVLESGSQRQISDLEAAQGFCLSRTAHRSSSTGMCSGNRAINQYLLYIRILTAARMQRLPNFMFTPTREAFKNRIPFTQ
ncbi:MAG: hypothetical protein RQ714_08245 [Nitrosomonas sp.]|nr:hypothetical protein [Nitrosomonas sp.]